MGAASFVTSEMLLLQTELFTKCFNFQDYFGLALATLFLPGLIVQLLQNRYDESFNRTYGTRAATLLRLVVGQVMILIPLFVFFQQLYRHHPTPLPPTLPSVTVLVLCFTSIGFGCAFVYGSSSQIVALVPTQYHSFFFIGLYLNSLIMAPTNSIIGQLFTIRDHHCTAVYWDRIVQFYGISSVVNVLGVLSFLVLCYWTKTGKSAVLGVVVENTEVALDADADQIENSAVDDVVGVPMHFVLSAVSPTPTEREHGVEKTSVSSIWCRLFYVGLAMLLCLMENILVSNEYHKLPVSGELMALPTIMMYSFYISMCVGSMASSFQWMQKHVNTTVLLTLATIRLPGVVCVFWYADLNVNQVRNGTAVVNPGDYGVLVFGSLYIVVGGLIFCRSFSIATELFVLPKEKAIAATVMNVLYFMGIGVVSGGILLMPRLGWPG